MRPSPGNYFARQPALQQISGPGDVAIRCNTKSNKYCTDTYYVLVWVLQLVFCTEYTRMGPCVFHVSPNFSQQLPEILKFSPRAPPPASFSPQSPSTISAEIDLLDEVETYLLYYACSKDCLQSSQVGLGPHRAPCFPACSSTLFSPQTRLLCIHQHFPLSLSLFFPIVFPKGGGHSEAPYSFTVERQITSI